MIGEVKMRDEWNTAILTRRKKLDEYNHSLTLSIHKTKALTLWAKEKSIEFFFILQKTQFYIEGLTEI